MKLIRTIIIIILYYLVWGLLLAGIFSIIDSFIKVDSKSLERLLWEIVPLTTVVFINIIFLKIFKVKKSKGKIKLEIILKSIVIGVIWIAIPVLIFYITNKVEIHGFNNIKLEDIIILTVSLFINVLFQEILVRDFIYRYIKMKVSKIVAFVISTLMFIFMHGMPTDLLQIINLIIMSILMIVILEKTESILCISIIHFIWNFVGGFILGWIELGEYPVLLNIDTSDVINLETSLIAVMSTIIIIFISYKFYNASLNHKFITK